MDDARSIPPLRPVAPRPSRDQRRSPREDARREGEEPSQPDGHPGGEAAPEADDTLVTALDRLRATDAPRTADLALMRLWRGLRAYQAADDGSGVHDAGAPR